jgi:ribosomal protein RSM22 (predicted rRNA methylase)
MRLFKDEDEDGSAWNTSYDVKYRSSQQAFRHAGYDGTAFASVALPAHYSAIYAVLNQTRQRLGDSWTVNTVYDWGAGTGSVLW